LRQNSVTDTICAISTPPGIGGVAVIRVSGPNSKDIVNRILLNPSLDKFRHGNFFHAFIKDHEKNEIVEEAVILYFQSPHSFTGEDVVEIIVHGGLYTPRLVLELLIKNGARLAEPGEFTRRAFLNGKMDLIQVQAMLDLIKAKSDLQVKFAMKKLRGELSKKFNSLKENLFALLREVEARVEFEEDVPPLDLERVKENLKNLLNEVNILLVEGERNSLVFTGIQIAITGKPNVGKSSLFNAILRMERAIVTPIPGTTRDLIHEEIYMNGIPVRIYDTAGIRETEEMVESIGIKKAQEVIENSHIVMVMFDASSPLSEEDLNLWKRISREKMVVLNKVDLGFKVDLSPLGNLQGTPVLEVSCKTGQGLEKLEKVLREKIQDFVLPSGEVSLSQRELFLLKEVKKEIEDAINSISTGPLDIVSFHLLNAIHRLNEIFGIGDIPEKILNDIFSNFCIGK